MFKGNIFNFFFGESKKNRRDAITFFRYPKRHNIWICMFLFFTQLLCSSRTISWTAVRKANRIKKIRMAQILYSTVSFTFIYTTLPFFSFQLNKKKFIRFYHISFGPSFFLYSYLFIYLFFLLFTLCLRMYVNRKIK